MRSRAAALPDSTGPWSAVAHSAVAPRTTRGSRSISRRTKRHVDAGLGAGVDDAGRGVSRGGVRDRHEHDVGRRPFEQRGRARRSCRAPGRPCILRRRSRGLSSTKPITRSPAVSRSSLHQAAAGAAGADDHGSAGRCGRASTARRPTIARSANLEPPTATMQISASTMKKERVEVAHVLRQTMYASAITSETTTAAGDLDRVARAGVAPDRAVEAERDEGEVARREGSRAASGRR